MKTYRVQTSDGSRSFGVYTATTARRAIRQAVKQSVSARETRRTKLRARPVKKFRVSWTETYEEEIYAETCDEAIENRTGDNAYQGCPEVNAEEVSA